jgi:hypothetical protein
MDSDEEEYMLDAFADGSRDQARLDLTGGEFSFSFFFFSFFFFASPSVLASLGLRAAAESIGRFLQLYLW